MAQSGSEPAGAGPRQQLTAALGLEAKARIAAVDETPVGSAEAGAQALIQALERGEVPRSTLEEGAGVGEIDVLPEGAPAGSAD